MSNITFNPPPYGNVSPIEVGAADWGAATDVGTTGFSYLTPDALMAYCQTKLQSTDSQMETYFNNEQTDAANQQTLTTLETAISASTASGITTGSSHAGMDLIAACQTAIDNVGGPNTPVGSQIAALQLTIAKQIDPSNTLSNALTNGEGGEALVGQYKSWLGQGTNAKSGTDVGFINSTTNGNPASTQTISATAVQSWSTNAQSIGTNIGNDSQMGMIQLQSIMSDRQTAIQTCTNLIQSMADQAKDISSNIGH